MANLVLNLRSAGGNLGLIFFAGETIEGEVRLSLDNARKCKGITVYIKGKSKAIRRLPNGTMTFRETYIDEVMRLTPRGLIELKAGTHTYNFQYDLPFRIPQTNRPKDTYKDTLKIRYYCEVVFASADFSDLRQREKFIVRRREYCNAFPILREPLTRECEKRFYGFFYKSEQLFMRVTIPHAGVACGELLPMQIHYDNKSRLEIVRTRIELVENEITTVENQSLCARETILAEDFAGGVEPFQTLQITHSLKIPKNTLISDILYSELLTIKHSIVVVGLVKGLHTSPRIFIPIVIGSDRYMSKIMEIDSMNVNDDLIIEEHLDKKCYYTKLIPWLKPIRS